MRSPDYLFVQQIVSADKRKHKNELYFPEVIKVSNFHALLEWNIRSQESNELMNNKIQITRAHIMSSIKTGSLIYLPQRKKRYIHMIYCNYVGVFLPLSLLQKGSYSSLSGNHSHRHQIQATRSQKMWHQYHSNIITLAHRPPLGGCVFKLLPWPPRK